MSESLRGFPFAKIPSQGERLTRSVVRTSSPLRSLRPCWTAILSILILFLNRRHMKDSYGVLCIN